MTANAMDTDREKCLQAGMNDHVSKPIDPDTLFATLMRWIKPREAAAVAIPNAVPSQTSSAPAGDSDSLVIPGIDTATALKRTGGNRKRYESLLNRFADSQAAAANDIHAALARNDSPTAQRLAHSLKGAAANLGAATVAAIAARAESAIDSRKEEIPQALEDLSQSLDATVANIYAALPKVPALKESTLVSANPSTVAQPLAQLKKLLAADDGDAADFILDARPNLSKVLTAAEIDTLIGHVGNFDYADALRSLSSIAARLALNLE
jgi:HPt (histidine-containing phosphotransfer) domain-containing protein